MRGKGRRERNLHDIRMEKDGRRGKGKRIRERSKRGRVKMKFGKGNNKTKDDEEIYERIKKEGPRVRQTRR